MLCKPQWLHSSGDTSQSEIKSKRSKRESAKHRHTMDLWKLNGSSWCASYLPTEAAGCSQGGLEHVQCLWFKHQNYNPQALTPPRSQFTLYFNLKYFPWVTIFLLFFDIVASLQELQSFFPKCLYPNQWIRLCVLLWAAIQNLMEGKTVWEDNLSFSSFHPEHFAFLMIMVKKEKERGRSSMLKCLCVCVVEKGGHSSLLIFRSSHASTQKLQLLWVQQGGEKNSGTRPQYYFCLLEAL